MVLGDPALSVIRLKKDRSVAMIIWGGNDGELTANVRGGVLDKVTERT